jgi:hypothetical protein
MTIDERAQEFPPEVLGGRLTPNLPIAPGVQVAGFYNAVLLDLEGQVYVLPEATVADRFRPVPAR